MRELGLATSSPEEGDHVVLTNAQELQRGVGLISLGYILVVMALLKGVLAPLLIPSESTRNGLQIDDEISIDYRRLTPAVHHFSSLSLCRASAQGSRFLETPS